MFLKNAPRELDSEANEAFFLQKNRSINTGYIIMVFQNKNNL